MAKGLDDEALGLLFRSARTHNAWRMQEISDVTLEAVYDLARMGPTSANCSPMRVNFVRSRPGKERLLPALLEANRAKTLVAPATAIIGYDLDFHERLPELFPHADARSWFVGDDRLIEATAFRNGSLQGAYLMLAARALGLDCGPMSGFDNEMVDREFFPQGKIKSNFLCNLGIGDPVGLFPRSPRLSFDDACRFA